METTGDTATHEPLLTGFISGGLMGSDPLDPTSFSGSSRALFLALQRQGAVRRMFGLSISGAEFMLRALPRFHPKREVWRRRVYQDVGYRRALTRALKRKVEDADHDTVILQLGAYADGPAVYGATPLMTYQDSLAAEYWTSPFVPQELVGNIRMKEKHLAFEKKIAQGAQRVLVTSDYMRRSFIENYAVLPERVVSVGMGMNATIPETMPARDYTRNIFLFIGKEFYRKGGKFLVAAFAKLKSVLPSAELHIVGPVQAPQETQGVDGLHFHGFLNLSDERQASQFYDLMKKSTVFILPTHYEPHGISVTEAMSYGIPAIVTNNWALSEMVEHGETGFHLPDLSVDGLFETMKEAASNPERLARMGKRAFAETPKRFNWDAVASRVIDAAQDIKRERAQG